MGGGRGLWGFPRGLWSVATAWEAFREGGRLLRHFELFKALTNGLEAKAGGDGSPA